MSQVKKPASDFAQEESLPVSDVRSMIRLLATIAAVDGTHRAKKRTLMDGLCGLVDADGWLWTMTRMDAKKKAPISLGIMHGGLNDHQVAGWIQMNHHRSRRPPDHPALVEEVKKGRHFTRSRDQLVEDEEWYNHETVRQFRLERGIDHSMHSIYPLDEPGVFSGVGMYRFIGKPAFSPRDRRLAHVVLSEVEWLHHADFPRGNSTGVERLSSRQREVLVLLLEGRTRAEIASLLGISPHTANDHAKVIYREFDVQSQIALIRRFQLGDGGDLPTSAVSPLASRGIP